MNHTVISIRVVLTLAAFLLVGQLGLRCGASMNSRGAASTTARPQEGRLGTTLLQQKASANSPRYKSCICPE